LYKILLSLFLLLTFNCFSLFAKIEIPQLNSPVIDQAGLLEPQSERWLVNLLQDLNSKDLIQLQVLTINSLEDEPIESFSIRATDKWKLGTSKKDNGILLLIAKNDRKLRIEVGQGLEGDLPDAYAKRIISDVIVPNFKKQNFSEGIVSGVLAIIEKTAPSYQMSSNEKAQQRPSVKKTKKMGWLEILVGIVFFIIFLTNPRLFFYMLLASRNGGGGGSWGGRSGGGWSGGGGGFSGGGASGSW